MELAIALTTVSSAAVIGPWLVAVATSRHRRPGPGNEAGGRPPDDYVLAA